MGRTEPRPDIASRDVLLSGSRPEVATHPGAGMRRESDSLHAPRQLSAYFGHFRQKASITSATAEQTSSIPLAKLRSAPYERSENTPRRGHFVQLKRYFVECRAEPPLREGGPRLPIGVAADAGAARLAEAMLKHATTEITVLVFCRSMRPILRWTRYE